MEHFKEALKKAICNNDMDFLEKERSKYSINERFEDENNDTLLLYSLSDPESKAYKFFLKEGADKSLTNDEGENIMHSIVYSGVSERILEVLDRDNINHQAKDGATPLLLAIALEKKELAMSLIQNGADVNIPDCEGNLPIHIACHIGALSLVVEILSRGTNLFAKTTKGNLPLALAVNAGHDEIVKLLFKRMYS